MRDISGDVAHPLTRRTFGALDLLHRVEGGSGAVAPQQPVV
jgi:hypothetical protein